MSITVIAHNIRSLYNVGSIFRNSAAFNIEKLYLTGFTATPPRKEIAKVALGAQDIVNWEQGEIFDVINNLKGKGYSVYGLEQGKGSIMLDEFVEVEKLVIILGNEVEGINKEVIQELDGLIEIPMGKKRSLNVAVASGIVMHTLMSL